MFHQNPSLTAGDFLCHVIYNPDGERGKNLLSECLAQKLTIKLWSHINTGLPYPYGKMKGCSQAHKQIIRYAKEKGYEETLVMEDDVHFVLPITEFLSKKPTDFDIYFAGVNRGEIKNGVLNKFTGTHCYLIHQRFYDTFLTLDENKHLDHALWGKGKFVLCQPVVAVQPDKTLRIW